MTEVLHSPSHFSPSSQRPNSDAFFSTQNPNSSSSSSTMVEMEGRRESNVGEEEEELEGYEFKRREKEREELSFLALLVALLRKSLVSSCSASNREIAVMDIGQPTDVRHVAHVTFDRFDGFLGLPVEFEPEVPRRAPSASTSVFGVSTESMQLSFDARGNCVPTILILMQRRLYAQNGLQEEGIFRITADNSQEELVRDQLNRGLIPDDIDVHCLAGLIKAWFRELPTGVLDPLSPEEVMQCESEEDCTELVRQLPTTEGALLDWAINLMADVVLEEHFNKMNAHNIAMVFAPNMTQMADPLTALMYAVRVMNFLKTLITKRLQDREDSRIEPPPVMCAGPSDESGHQSPSQPCLLSAVDEDTEGSEPVPLHYHSDDESFSYTPSKQTDDGVESDDSPFHWHSFKGLQASLKLGSEHMFQAPGFGQLSNSDNRKELLTVNSVQPEGPTEKPKSLCNLSRISSTTERIEAWR
ncbi:rho GTPase-activating protein 1-like [Silene latifolia]|uniref:rho GTPase-activating protein 1-like n=1 Tax=Silene latifolia TaxID=37657 RepID=UPI003D77D25A